MTSPNPLTRQDLLELAALDALGLLDEFDSAHYTRSFHDAPAAVQDEIKLRQAELASDRTLLPEEGPTPSLRQRVLDGVAEAVEQNDQELAPLAQIGQRYRATVASSAEGFGQTSAPFWRAAVFVLAAAVVVLAYFAADAYRQGNLIAVAALNNNTAEQLEGMIGPTIKDFLFDPNTRWITFEPSDRDTTFQALVLVNDRNEVFLVTDGLPPSNGAEYTLRVSHAGGTTETVSTFKSNGTLTGARYSLADIAANELASATWLITNSEGIVVLRSA